MAKTNNRRVTAHYLYSDGTLVTMYDEYRDSVHIGESADVTYGYCKVHLYARYAESNGYRTSKPGRIVMSRYSCEGFVTLAKGGTVTGIAPSLEGGSENTKSRGIEVQYVTLKTKTGLELSWSDTTSIMSSAFTVQADEKWEHPGVDLSVGDSLWNDYRTRVLKVTDLRPKTVAAVVPAATEVVA